MRPISIVLALAAASLAAQAPASGRHWSLGLLRLSPDLNGSAFFKDGSQTSSFDLQRDLALDKDTTTLGFTGAYEGPRFMVLLQSGAQSYRGRNTLTRQVTVDGTTYDVGTDLSSRLKLQATELTWVIKVLRSDWAYLGADLGVNAWKLDVDATGTYNTDSGPATDRASDSMSAPIPQIGLSSGVHFPGGFGGLRASYHLLKRGDATYHRTGIEGTAYPLRWLGVRVFHETESVDIPQGSLSDDVALDVSRKGTGFGVVVRF